jgi:prepilin-type N-terminal cleavage/methylation domain-containing protein
VRTEIRASHRGERGVTLIELLISITLVAAIISGLLFAMRTSLVAYQRVNERLDEDRHALGIQQALERQISGVIPTTGACGPGQMAIFNGDQQSLRFLSDYSLAEGSRGYPRIIEYQVAPDKDGGVRLMINERLYGGPASIAPLCSGNAFAPVQITAESIQAIGRLAYLRIGYREYIPGSPLEGKWVPSWNRPMMPAAVRLEMQPLDSAPRLPLQTLDVPIRITRDVGFNYGE